MNELEWRNAQVRVNNLHEWKLRVFGTDIYYSAYRNRDPELEPFPGQELGDKLSELGWTPDRRTLTPVRSGRVQRMIAHNRAGWTPAMERNVWTIRVYREKPATLPLAGGRQPVSM